MAAPTTAASDAIIEARGVEKRYDQAHTAPIQVIAPTDLSVRAGEILAVLGPSGSGKSTFLRMLTGLSTPSAGQVLWHGEPMSPEIANVSIVFQSFALFPWLTVIENVEAPLKAKGINALERRKRSLKILDTVGLDGFEGAYPKELSGGMRQRVGFARALVVEPEVLFMDEPFSALDVLTAENLRNELLELWGSKKIPTRAIFIVTHNIEEAVLLADRVIVLGKNPGRIRTDLQVNLDRPRDRKESAFGDLVDHIYTVLTSPDRVEPKAVPTAVGASAPVKEAVRYQMLPHARPGGITGLLEILAEQPEAMGVSTLADELAFDVDDLFPIVEAAALLGFLTVSDGEVQITATGNEFVEADIQVRKELFRKACMEHCTLVRQIARSLASKSNHTLPADFFHDTLEEHFSEDETVRQVETAINWGRYAELYDYDSVARKFFIPTEMESAPVTAGEGKSE